MLRSRSFLFAILLAALAACTTSPAEKSDIASLEAKIDTLTSTVGGVVATQETQGKVLTKLDGAVFGTPKENAVPDDVDSTGKVTKKGTPEIPATPGLVATVNAMSSTVAKLDTTVNGDGTDGSSLEAKFQKAINWLRLAPAPASGSPTTLLAGHEAPVPESFNLGCFISKATRVTCVGNTYTVEKELAVTMSASQPTDPNGADDLVPASVDVVVKIMGWSAKYTATLTYTEGHYKDFGQVKFARVPTP